jgi:hypothetical protein
LTVKDEKARRLRAQLSAVPATELQYDRTGGIIFGRCKGGSTMTESVFRVADVRGWGHLQYRPNGQKEQDAIGHLFAGAKENIAALLDDRDERNKRIAELETAGQSLAHKVDDLLALIRGEKITVDCDVSSMVRIVNVAKGPK